MNTSNPRPLVVITGASSGIGASLARTFSVAGYPLLLLARRQAPMQALQVAPALCIPVDVTDGAAVCAAIAQGTQAFGPVGCLINNAGVMLLGEASSQSPVEWRQMLDVNVMGVLNGIHAVLADMKTRQTGTIINISSVAGRKTFPNHAVYCATKFAVHALTENIREEVSGSDVRLVTIAPGVVETELLSHTTHAPIRSNYEDWKTQIGGALDPDAVAQAALFAFLQPQSVCVREIVLAPTRQQP